MSPAPVSKVSRNLAEMLANGDETSGAMPPRVSFGPYVIDEAAGILLRDGEPVNVGRRGVALLLTLAKRAGEVVTKADLMDAAWPGLSIEESNLSVQIAALRKALGSAPGGGEWIVTIPRVGYRLVAPGGPADPAARTRHPGALEAFVRGRSMLLGPTLNDGIFTRMLEAFEKAITIDPAFAAAYAGLAEAHVLDGANGWTGDRAAAHAKARELADEAVAIDPTDVYAISVSALVALAEREPERALRDAGKALALSPGNGMASTIYGCGLTATGRPLEAIPHLEHAIRTEPMVHHYPLHYLGIAHFAAGKYATAAALFRERIVLVPSTDMSRGFLAAALCQLGRYEEARAVWDELMAINPRWSLDERLRHGLAIATDDVARLLDGLRRAGIPA